MINFWGQLTETSARTKPLVNINEASNVALSGHTDGDNDADGTISVFVLADTSVSLSCTAGLGIIECL